MLIQSIKVQEWQTNECTLCLPRPHYWQTFYTFSSFHVNLLLVSSLMHHHSYYVIFNLNSFVIEDIKTLKMIGKGGLHQDLNVFTTNNGILSCVLLVLIIPLIFPFHVINLCHSRLGHNSDKILKVFCNKANLLFDSNYNSNCCIVCPLSKLRR